MIRVAQRCITRSGARRYSRAVELTRQYNWRSKRRDSPTTGRKSLLLNEPRLVEALGRGGFSSLFSFPDSKSGAAAFAARRRSDGTALLAFRKTRPDSCKDLRADLQADLVTWPESAGRVHRGFAADLRPLRPQILEWIDAAEPYCIPYRHKVATLN